MCVCGGGLINTIRQWRWPVLRKREMSVVVEWRCRRSGVISTRSPVRTSKRARGKKKKSIVAGTFFFVEISHPTLGSPLSPLLTSFCKRQACNGASVLPAENNLRRNAGQTIHVRRRPIERLACAATHLCTDPDAHIHLHRLTEDP